MAYTKEIINVGSTVDDGTGDLLRDAFTKVNTNFTNIWDKGGVNSNLNLTEFSITSDGDLILNPTTDILLKKKTIINSDKGDFDLIVHGDTVDNVLYVDASTNRVGILNSSPTVALDITGSAKVSATTTTEDLTVTGNTILGNDVSDLITLNGRLGTDILPNGSRSIGSTTNRFTKLSVTDIDATGSISGTFTGTVSSATTLTNNINSTTIVGDTIQATTSAEVGNLLVTGTLAVQGSSVTIDSATMQILDKLTFEGATADDFETSIVATDATADRTITLPDADGNIALFTTAPTGAIADGTAGQVLTTDGAGALSFTTASGGASAINDLSDVTITTATNGQVLKYNGSAWVNAASGIALTDLSVSVAAAGSSTLAYDDSTGAFTFTPPDLSTYVDAAGAITAVTGSNLNMGSNDITTTGKVLFANMYATEGDLPNATTYHGMFAHVHATGAGYFAHGGAWVKLQNQSELTADIDTHLNQSNPTSGYVLSWNGTDYAWVSNAGGGGGISLTDLSVGAEGSASGDGAIAYDNSSGEFTYTPPDLSTYLTSVSEASVTAHQAALSITESQISDLGTYQTTAGLNGAIDTHLNQSNPTSGYVLTWNGTDYAWTANGTGSGIGDIVDDTTPQLGGTLDANGNTIDMGTNVLTDTNLGQFITAYGWGDHGSAGYLTSFTETNDLSAAVTWVNVPDANITQSSVTQHQANLTITESQISDLGTYQTSAGLNAAIDAHLNQTDPDSGYVLSWNGTDYAWISNTGYTSFNSDFDTRLAAKDTGDLTEGSNLYYTNARADARIAAAGFTTLSDVDAVVAGDDGKVLYYDHSSTSFKWKTDATGGATSINTAGNTGTGSVTFASETLTVTGTTGQIDVDAAGFALSLSLDADLTGLTTINSHTIPSGTGTLALMDSTMTYIDVNDESSDTTCFPMFGTGQIGALTVKTDGSAYTYNASTETLSVTNFSGDLSGKVVHSFNVANNGSSDYTFGDDANHWFPTTENDPVLYLRRGETYNFVVTAGGSHPFEIRVSNGGSAYNTGVTNNGTGSGTIVFKVPMSAPATLYYQCTNHSGMGNTINIV
jgi:hypothetical protein